MKFPVGMHVFFEGEMAKVIHYDHDGGCMIGFIGDRAGHSGINEHLAPEHQHFQEENKCWYVREDALTIADNVEEE